jgi:carbamoyltransferase
VPNFIGFDRFGEEYKVMALSAYGEGRFVRELRDVVSFDPQRGMRLNLAYFQHHEQSQGLEISDEDEVRIPKLYSERLAQVFGPARDRRADLTARDRDLAASMQLRFEEVYLDLMRAAVKETGCRTAVMAGGSVLNSVGNGKLLSEGVLDRAYFHPAASDDGTAAGAALWVWHNALGLPRTPHLNHAYLGPEYDNAEIERALSIKGINARKLDRVGLLETAASAIASGKIVGWFQGREEWGPRALGNRSILCHPGWPNMKATLNARIKNCQPFRPFAPAVLEEKLSTCFDGSHEVPFMIVVYKVRPEWKERLSATTHEDDTGRVQTVSRTGNPLYYDLIRTFEGKTGIPVLLNTSFNENEPIVHTPEQAIDCFSRTKMDALGLGNYWLEKPGA